MVQWMTSLLIVEKINVPLEGIWGRGRAVSGPFPCAVLDAA